MPSFLKTSAGILLLSLPFYIGGAALIAAILRRTRTDTTTRSELRGLATAIAVFHAAPMLVFLRMLASGYWAGNYGFGSDTVLSLLFAHGVAGPVILAGAATVILLPVLVFLRYRDDGSRPAAERRRLALFLCILLSFLSSAYQHTVVRGMTTVVREERTLDRAADGRREIVISLLADTQADAFTGGRRLGEYADAVRRDHPDLVLFAGDIASATLDMTFPRIALECLVSIRPSVGTWAVMGDHDFWSGWSHVDSVYQHVGVPRLLNDAAHLDCRGVPIDLLGLTNVLNDPADARRLDTLLARRRSGAFSILLVHQLSDGIAEQAARAGVDLVVAGHTHGGQIAVPLLNDVLRWFGLSSRYVSGWHALGRTHIYVCNGIGLSVLPLRVWAVPSFGVVRLRG